MATTTLPRPEPTQGATPRRRRMRRSVDPAARPRVIPAEERELHEELIASALLLLAVLALLGAVVGGTMGVLWLFG